MKLLTTFSVLAALVASDAVALAIAPQCKWDAQAGRINTLDGQGEEVFPNPIVGPFVEWYPYGGNGQIVLQNCANNNYLIVTFPADEERAVQTNALMQEMIRGETGFTMQQMGDAVAPFGAQSQFSNGNIGRCACELAGY